MKLLWKFVLGALLLMMAEVERATQVATSAGAEPTVITGMSAADTQLIPNKNGNVQLRVINGVTADTIMTVVTPNADAGGNPIEDRKVEIKKEKTKVIGPFDPNVYNNKNGMLEVKFSAVTNVTLEIQQVGF